MDSELPGWGTEARLAGLTDGLELIATRRLGCAEDGRDAAQETLVRVLERQRSGWRTTDDEMARVAYGILRHVIADIHRLRAREVPGIDHLEESSPDPLETLVRDDERRKVHAALCMLSDSERTLLGRCYVKGERIVEIAAALGEPADRIRKRKSRALERLAARLNGLQASQPRHPPAEAAAS
ncbi:MAG TPA: sigma-70 family RNA polymerase sigma factor [Gemmatimonadaceae bacterium]